MLRRQLLRDVVLRAHVGNLRVSAVVARKTIAEGARRWDTPTTALTSQLWSEYMVGTVMLSSFFKGEERVKMVMRAPTTNEEVYVEALAVGEVRGKASMLGGSGSEVFADAQMEVSKIMYGESKPYVTSVPATGNAEHDWQTFYDVSEQVPTVVRVGHAVEDDELRCCGLTIQKMPDSAPHDRVYDLSDLRFDSASFSPPSLADKDDLVEYLNELIPNADLKEGSYRKVPLDFFCRCSKKGFSHRLSGLGHEQLSEIVSDTGDKGIELTCHFCNEMYQFSLGDLQEIASGGPTISKL